MEVRDGEAAIVPGKPELSGLMARIVSEDGDEVMPPPSSHRERLKGEEVELLRRWILEGAEWGKHWAYEKPVRGEAPLGGEGEAGAKAAGFPLRSAIDGWVWWRHPSQDDYRLVAPVRLPRVTGVRLEVLPDASHTKGAYSRGKSGEFVLTDIKVQVRRRGSSQVRDVAVKSAVADTVATGKGGYGDVQGVLDDDPRNGWTTKGAAGKTVRTAVFGFAEPVVAGADEELVIELRQRSTLGDAGGVFGGDPCDSERRAGRSAGDADPP
jgi:hypothetical protein